MKKKTNPAIPSMPSGMVKVNKGPFRDIVVGVVNGSRIPSFGFDVAGMPPNHWRLVEHGAFGILIGARNALEVRVVLDGETILETKLYPSDPPANHGMDEKVRAMMAESPQPHFLTRSNSGEPFMFKAHDYTRPIAEIIASQVHPGAFEAPPALDIIDNGAPVTEELKLDLDLSKLPFVKAEPPAAPDNAVDAPVEGDTAGDGAGFPGWTGANDALASSAKEEPTADNGLPADLPADVVALLTGQAPAEPEGEKYPVIDVTTRARSWAPSNGLVAVGIRLLQEAAENEPPTAPDAFTYVLFQMNPWDVHVAARNMLTRRIIMPSQEAMGRMMEDEGYDDKPAIPRVVCACSKVGPHSH